MLFTGVLTPGYQFAPNELVDTAKLNLGFLPTIAGTVTFADGTGDASVTSTSKVFTVFDLSNNILRVAAGHGFSTGQRLKVSSATTLPSGLVAGTEYYARLDGSNPTTDFTLHYTANGAANNSEVVDITTAGTGTHTLVYYSFATGHAFVFDSGGNTWEKGIVSPESLPEMVGATASTPGVRGAVPQPGPGTTTDYLARDGTFKAIPNFGEVTGLFIFNRLNFN